MTVDRLVENAMYIHELADMMLLAEDISEESIDASWYGDDEIAREYSERDRKVYSHLMEDKYLRQYIEESVGKHLCIGQDSRTVKMEIILNRRG